MSENKPTKRIIYIAALAALAALLVLVFALERRKNRTYQQLVADAAGQETELARQTSAVSNAETPAAQTEKETKAAAPAKSESETKTTVSAQPGNETKAAAPVKSESETKTTVSAQTGNETEAATPAQTESENKTTVSAQPGNETEVTAPAQTESETKPADPARPVLTLKQESVTIQAGDTFDPVLYVDTITDDEDDMWYLWRNIQVNHEYDTEKAGEYEITYLVVDSSGRSSLPQKLKLIVKR